MHTNPLIDIINKPRQTRNNSPYAQSYSSSKRQSAVLSANSHYSELSNNKSKADEKTVQQLYQMFKKQGLDNVRGLLKFLEVYRQEIPQRKSQSPILRTQPEETMDREKVSSMLSEAKFGLNQLQTRIKTFQTQGDSRNNCNKYKNLLTEDDENHEYLYESKQLQQDYKKLYSQAQKDKEQMSQQIQLNNKRIEQLLEENKQRDSMISQLGNQVNQLQQQFAHLIEQQQEHSSSPKPSISASDYTFTLNVCNSDFKPEILHIKDILHTQSQQIKRT